MNNSAVFQGLLDHVLTMDFRQTDIDTLFESIQPYLEKLADKLYVAKAELHYDVSSDIYNIEKSNKTFERVYSENVAPDSEAVTQTKKGDSNKSITIWPVSGHKWTNRERRDVAAISNLVLMSFSHAAMEIYHSKIPYIDSVTGILNHPGMRHYGKEIEKTYSIEDYTGCFVHVGNFRYFNQHFGHLAADEIICQCAGILYENTDHECELVARLGAANFFALIRNTNLEKFIELISNMQVSIDQGSQMFPLSVHTRVGICPAHADDNVSELITKASFSYEQSKLEKVNIVYFNQDKMNVSLQRKAMREMLPNAIEKGEITPFYQPKVDMDSGILYGCEALARWIHEGKIIPPGEFIPVAEEIGMITKIDLYMLRAVCRDLRSWIDSGLEPVGVSVNYSQQDFANSSLISDTLAIIGEYGIDGKYIEFEITETSYIERFAALDEFIKTMHEHGIKVSLDDFGTGYSSLKMFGALDIDTVKLDKSLFDNIRPEDKKSRVILKTIASMIDQINSTAIAEGIETDDQLTLVHDIGGHVVQGYIFDKPLMHEEFTKRLKDRKYKPYVKGA